jgi:hypothetical protein
MATARRAPSNPQKSSNGLLTRISDRSAEFAAIISVLMLGALCVGCAGGAEDRTDEGSRRNTGSPESEKGAAGSGSEPVDSGQGGAHADAGSSCDPSSKTCPCTEDSCPDGQTCDSNGKCTSACSTACSGTTPSCNASTKTCVCTSTSCPAGQTCSNAACVPQPKEETIADIATAAKTVHAHISAHKALPSTVTMGPDQVNMPSFLMLEGKALEEINAGNNAAIVLKSYEAASAPKDATKQGQLQKSEFVTIAKSVESYMASNNKAPNYVQSSLGEMGFNNLVYAFAKILDYYGSNQRLPNYVTLDIFSQVSDLDTVGNQEAKYNDCQQNTNPGCSDWRYMETHGCGDCWADSEWLYNHLSAAGVQVRVVGYSNCPSGSVWYRHAWVQINTGSGWHDWSYSGYSSHHFGNGGGYSTIVLIPYGTESIDVNTMIATGY